MTDTTQYKHAVLLLAFGGPENLDEVEPFLKALMGGRQLSNHQIEAVKERYRLIGGGSPLKSITYRQANALEKMLNEGKSSYKVFVGMRYTAPLIEQVVDQILALGIDNIIVLPLTPYYNSASTGVYLKKIEQVVKDKVLNLKIIKKYNTNSFFIRAIEKNILDTIKYPEKYFFIFSAHSLPLEMAKTDGYVEQLKQTVELILKDMPISNYKLAFQSRGMTGGEWLGPDVKEVLDMCKHEGKKDIAIVPVGFVSDHVETLYDIDIMYRQHALSLGLNFLRIPSLNTSEYFIRALKEEVTRA